MTTDSDISNQDSDISRSVRSSMIWSVLEYGFSQVVTVCVFIFLTFQLEPAVFGIFALAVILIDYFVGQGKSAAVDVLLRRQEFDKLQLNSAFCALSGSYFAGLILCFVVGLLIANLSGEEIFRFMLPALCLTLIPTVLEIVPGAILSKARDFKGAALRQVLGTSCGGVVAVLFAVSDYPEWTLVAQRLTQVTICALFMCLRAKWFPSLNFDAAKAKSFLKDWSKVFFAQSIAISLSRVIDLIVGLSLGTTELGVLRIASRLIGTLYGVLGTAIGRIWVILVSEIDDPTVRSGLYSNLTHLSGLIFIPVFFGLFALSEECVSLILSAEYQGAGQLLQVFSIVGLFAPLVYFRNAAFTALGLLDKLVVFCLIDIVIATILCLTFIGLGFGLTGAVASLICVAIFQSFLIAPVLLEEMSTKARVIINVLVPAYLAGAVMCATLFIIKALLNSDPNWGHTLLLIITGAAIFFGFLLCFYRRWLVDGIAFAVPSLRDHPMIIKLVG